MFGRLLFVVLTAIAHARPTEEERVRLWLENVKQWPPTWHAANESTEYQAAQSAREAEIQAIPGANERWENWMQFTQGRMVKKFTPMGFKVVKTPKDIHDRLVAKVQDAIDHQWESLPEESDVGDAIYGENRPLFVEMDGLDWEVSETGRVPFPPRLVFTPIHAAFSCLQAVDALKELHEEWGGMKLVPTSAYGVRLYRYVLRLRATCHALSTEPFLFFQGRRIAGHAPRQGTYWARPCPFPLRDSFTEPPNATVMIRCTRT